MVFSLFIIHYSLFIIHYNMEDTLKRLLLVENEAEQEVVKANANREQIIQQALDEAHQAEQQLIKAKIPEIHANWLDKAQGQANQTIAELNKRYEERKARLRVLAEENQPKALDAAVQLLMQVGK
jgi:vacuolar-type H+-ATPase subunit H